MTRVRWLPLFAFLTLSAGPLVAQTDQDLVDWMNEDFAQKAWPEIRDFVKNSILHNSVDMIEAQAFGPIAPEVTSVTADMSGNPHFELDGNEVVARFPETGTFQVDLQLKLPIDDPIDLSDVKASVTVEIAIVVRMSASGATFEPETTSVVKIDADATMIELSLLSGPNVAFTASALLAATNWLQQAAPGLIVDRVEERFQENLGMLTTLLFDSSVGLAFGTPDVELVLGHPDLPAHHGINVLLVADGWTAAELPTFQAVTEAMADQLVADGPDGAGALNEANEPYRSFRSVLRVERLNLTVADGSNAAERVLGSFEDGATGTTKSSILNLARLARIGLLAKQRMAHVIVLVANANNLGGTPRANAFGFMVLLPADGDEPNTLQHELGHTIFGRLGDEYVDGAFETTTYRGHEPIHVNVTRHAPPALPKWSWWMMNPAALQTWDDPVSRFEGAYTYGAGIWRPAETCKMNDSADPFCAVCREAVTRGLVEVQTTTVYYGGNVLLVEADYSAPWSGSKAVSMQTDQTSTYGTLAAYPGDLDTVVALRLGASSLPEPWSVEWTHRRGGDVIATAGGVEPAAPFAVRRFDRIDVKVESLCTFAPNDVLPVLEFELRFDEDMVPNASPTKPSKLWQSVPTGAVVPLSYDPATGEALFDLDLQAVAGEILGWKGLPMRLEFRLEQVGAGFHPATSFDGKDADPVTYEVEPLPEAKYRWSVRTVYEFPGSNFTLSSPWAEKFLAPGMVHFEVGPPAYEKDPAKPKAPYALDGSLVQASGSKFPTPDMIVLSAKSMDVNGDDVQFQFELNLDAEPFDGTSLAASPWIGPGLDSLVVEGTVSALPWTAGVYKWRVRAIDSTGLATEWVAGGSFEAAPGTSGGDLRLEPIERPIPSPEPDPFEPIERPIEEPIDTPIDSPIESPIDPKEFEGIEGK